MSYRQNREFRVYLQQMIMDSRVEIGELPRQGAKHQTDSSDAGCLSGFDVFVYCFIEKAIMFSDLAKYFVF